MTRLLLLSNSAWNLAHFRGPLIDDLLSLKVELVAALPEGDNAAELEARGLKIETVRLDRSGTSPIGDARLLADYVKVMRAIRPDVVLGFTAKPNIYGSIAARSVGACVINNISGLGTGFLKQGWLRRIMLGLYRIALSRSPVVFFQNEDDRDLFLAKDVVRARQARILRGSGIDLDHFDYRTMPTRDGAVHFLLVARMLRDKGVEEFVAAARMLRAQGVEGRWSLLGPAGDDNPTAISAAQLRGWDEEGVVRWRGPSDDVRPFMEAADVVVLPSYREGMPRTLLEAAAVGRPVIATDVPGCRQAVMEGETGFLCQPRDPVSLATAMRRMADAGAARRRTMGEANRGRAEREFSAAQTIAAYRDALAACGTGQGD